MNPVVQQEKTGCGIASCAAIAGFSYDKTRQIANSLGIYAEDETLWSDTRSVRKILKQLGIKTRPGETPFKDWESLPGCALLAIKWHRENGKPFWHWAVFVRENGKEYVLDSKKALASNVRTDFGRIKPKWFIKVHLHKEKD